MSNPTAGSNQRPDIDGLRAIAILPVVFFHANLGFPGGFVGVDVFFVISGFLISGIIFRELDTGAFTFARFWERRIRRIAPVLLVFVACTLTAGYFVLNPRSFGQLAAQSIAAMAGVANFYMQSRSEDYWAQATQSQAMLHTWSLAVEEQFYLVTPFVLALVYRWRLRAIGPILFVGAALSFAGSIILGGNHPQSNFYLLPTRAWELLLGCLGAYSMHRGKTIPRGLASWTAAIGLLLIVGCSLSNISESGWPGLWTLLPTIGTLLILVSPPVEPGHFIGNLLSLAPMRFIGLISYSLYLWHWPLLVFSRILHPGDLQPSHRWLIAFTAVVLAALSWKYVEQPFRYHGSRANVRTRPLVFGVIFAWVTMMTITLKYSQEADERERTLVAALEPQLARRLFNSKDRPQPLNFDATSHIRSGGIRINGSAGSPRCVLLGSSHAQMLGPLFASLCQDYELPGAILVQGGTSGLFAGNNEFVRAWHRTNATKRERDQIVKQWIAEWHPDVVVLAGRWAFELSSYWAPKPGDSEAAFEKALRETITWLHQHSGRVVIVAQVPSLAMPQGEDFDFSLLRQYRINNSTMPSLAESPSETERRHRSVALFSSVSSKDEKLIVVNPEALFRRRDGTINYWTSDGLFYWDDNHMSPRGAERLRPILEPYFREIAAAESLNATTNNSSTPR